jgi:hypothetical protein
VSDHFDWFGALKASATEARELTPQRTLHPVVQCRCGASEDQGRELGTPVDLRGEDVAVVRNDGIRPCRACPHYIHVGAMRVTRYFEHTNTVRDYYHPECVRL